MWWVPDATYSLCAPLLRCGGWRGGGVGRAVDVWRGCHPQLWHTDLQGMWRGVAGTFTFVTSALTSGTVVSALDWLLWLASFGFLSLGTAATPPPPRQYGYGGGTQGSDVATGAGTRPYLAYAALFCGSQVASAALKYTLMTGALMQVWCRQRAGPWRSSVGGSACPRAALTPPFAFPTFRARRHSSAPPCVRPRHPTAAHGAHPSHHAGRGV